MKLHLVAIFDSAAEVYGQLNGVTSLGGTIRVFGDEVNNPQGGDLHKHPEDFVMMEFGTFDNGSGEFELLDRPRQVVRAVDCVKGDDNG